MKHDKLGDMSVSQFSILSDAGARLTQIIASDVSRDESIQDEGYAMLIGIADALCALSAEKVTDIAKKVRIWRVLAPEDVSPSSCQADERLLASVIRDIELLAVRESREVRIQIASG